jgi:hypothetical protein
MMSYSTTEDKGPSNSQSGRGARRPAPIMHEPVFLAAAGPRRTPSHESEPLAVATEP